MKESEKYVKAAEKYKKSRENKKKKEQARAKKAAERAREKQELSREKAIERIKKNQKKQVSAKQKAEKKAAHVKIREARRKEQDIKAAARRKSRAAVYRKIIGHLRNNPHGFDYRNYGIIPRVELTVFGDAASVAASFAKEKIQVKDFEKSSGKVRLKIRKKDMKKAIAILERLCYNYKTGDSYGIGRTGAFLAARLGLSIGAAACVIALNIAYSYVWRIEIEGNDKLSKAAIERVLTESGFVRGMKKTAVNTKEVSAAVNTLYGVSDASAVINGTTLYVFVLEADEFVERKTYPTYISDYDATVTRVALRSGTSHVKRGDIVKCGDVLADGNVYSTAGELLYSGDCDCDVYGTVALSFGAELSTVVPMFERTGAVKRKTVFSLFGFDIGSSESPFASYEMKSFKANYDVLIPLYVTVFEYYETRPVEVECDIQAAARDFALEKAEQLRFLGDFDYTYTVKQTVAGLYRVNVFLSGEALISRGAE